MRAGVWGAAQVCPAKQQGLLLTASSVISGTARRDSPLAAHSPGVSSRSQVPHILAAAGRSSRVVVRAAEQIIAPESASTKQTPVVRLDNSSDETWTVLEVTCPKRPGLLSSLTALFRDQCACRGSSAAWTCFLQLCPAWHAAHHMPAACFSP